MGGDITQNSRERSDLEWIMVWNGDMVLAVFSGDEADVTAGLAA
jgi:hypothetical protein